MFHYDRFFVLLCRLGAGPERPRAISFRDLAEVLGSVRQFLDAGRRVRQGAFSILRLRHLRALLLVVPVALCAGFGALPQPLVPVRSPEQAEKAPPASFD